MISHTIQTSLSTGSGPLLVVTRQAFTQCVVCISNELARNVMYGTNAESNEDRQRAHMGTERKSRLASCSEKLSVRSILFIVLLSLSFLNANFHFFFLSLISVFY
jgi:hypothetical protein